MVISLPKSNSLNETIILFSTTKGFKQLQFLQSSMKIGIYNMRWATKAMGAVLGFSVNVQTGANTLYFILITRFSFLFYFTRSLHFTPGLQSAVCILPSVCILRPVCSLQSAVCSLRFTLIDIETHFKSTETFLYTHFSSCHPLTGKKRVSSRAKHLDFPEQTPLKRNSKLKSCILEHILSNEDIQKA